MASQQRSQPIGLVGCGRWGRHILKDLVALGARVTVVAPSAATRAFAREHGAADAVAGLDELPAVAGAVVATPTATHAAVLDVLLERGVPNFCEKPLTPDPATARRLAERGAGRLFVMHKWRYHPGIERLAEIARNGTLGPVVGLATVRVQPGRVHHDVDPFWTLAPHDLSIGLEILGYLPAPRVAVAERRGSDVVGLVGVLGDAPWMVIEVSASHAAYRREVRLVCRDGSVMLGDGYADALQVVRPAPPGAGDGVERWAIATDLPLRRELEAFLAHVEGGPPPRSSAAEAAAIVETLASLRALAAPGLEVTPR
jgi:predicted dehydrogenase